MTNKFSHYVSLVLVSCLLIATIGCGGSDRSVAFEPNLVHAMKYQIQENVPMDQAMKDTTWIVDTMFGTPDSPRLPEVITEDAVLSKVVSMERLTHAAGPFRDGHGIYRQYCATCHGITGNGRGTTSAVLPVYPRDYRMGIFKFKSTSRGSKPTRQDIANLIRNGIGDTAMKKISELAQRDVSDEDVEALVDYVIYLSMRGQLERALLDGAAMELDLEGGDRVIDTEFGRNFQTNKALIEKLADIKNENVDADDLLDFDNYNDMAKRLKNEPELEDKLKAGEDGLVALTSYLQKKYAAKEQVLAELNKLLDEPYEVEEETTAELVAELADALTDRYEDFVDLGEELAEDADLKARLEGAAAKTTGKELERYELYLEALEFAEDTVADLATEWLEAPDNVTEVPEPPSIIPVAESYEQYLALSKGDQAEAMAASVERGRELFVGKIANCSKCHGEKGRGDGQTTDYDDWTKDWTSRVGLKPENREALIPLLARGALPPKNAIPRNLEDGVFYGGSSSADLYRRITQGIEGSPMPAATFVEGQFQQDDVWHLINFIRSLQKPQEEAAEPKVTAQASL